MAESTTSPDPISVKARIVEKFISNVGLPIFIILVIIGVIVAMLVGYVDSPIITKSMFQSHALVNDQIHDAMIKNSTANTEALRQITSELRSLRLGISCDRKANDRDKLRCYQENNGPVDFN